jgi:hypothetical protein
MKYDIDSYFFLAMRILERKNINRSKGDRTELVLQTVNMKYA